MSRTTPSTPQPRNPTTSRPRRQRPLSADFLSMYPSLTNPQQSQAPPPPSKSSMLYSFLPTVVQSRLPRLPSLRRSVSMYGLPTKLRRTQSANTSTGDLRDGMITPNRGALVLSSVQASGLGSSADGDVFTLGSTSSEEEYDEEDRFGVGRRKRGSRGGMIEVNFDEKESGIAWKFAGQGLNLLTMSMGESSAVSSKDAANTADASFTRQLYIHALTYLLRGLPSDLTPTESLTLTSSLPESLHPPPPPQLLTGPSQPLLTHSRPAHHAPSLLHRTLANTIIHFFILLQLVLPYLRILAQKVYNYERRNHLSEKIMAGSLDIVDELSRRGWGVSAAVWSAGVGNVLGWLLEEVGGGVREGVEVGLKGSVAPNRWGGMERGHVEEGARIYS